MLVELTNRLIEMSAIYEVESIQSDTYGSKTYFRFYFGRGRYSKEYSTPNYDYRVLEY